MGLTRLTGCGTGLKLKDGEGRAEKETIQEACSVRLGPSDIRRKRMSEHGLEGAVGERKGGSRVGTTEKGTRIGFNCEH